VALRIIGKNRPECLFRRMKAFEFCIPTAGIKVPAGPEWVHEIKYDGFRLRVERDGDRVRLITRGGTIGPSDTPGLSRRPSRTKALRS
jgi:ATP-dependent DNA ligase